MIWKANRIVMWARLLRVMRTQRSFGWNARNADPVFGLPLWFQGNVKGDTLWASNQEHLLEIRSYVTARLGERQTMRITTMVEKLPQFIKAAKNREAVLKAIERMLKK